MVRLLLASVFVFSVSVSASGPQTICTREQAIKAEAEAEKLTDAKSIYRFYKRFRHCDDGAIAEGYSDSVVRLLAHNWGEMERLNEFTSSDKQFERFILRHTGETMTREDQQAILDNVRKRCPVQAHRLCGLLKKAVDR